ncbi:MAG TPA: hypothetical protein VE987_08575, partial [Polyangiaceae bacterium]|nr:hypothetical protein [Polyangiaceae bacterium]
LAAYRSQSRWDATRELRQALRALCDELFDGACSGLRGSDVYYPHIGLRVFAVVSFAMPIALGLADHHAGDELVCTAADWPGLALYRALSGVAAPQPSRARWIGRVAAFTAAGWIASSLEVLVTYGRSQVGLRRLRRRASRRRVALWLQLLSDFPRANATVIEATRGQDVGVLLHGHLGRGERDESQLRRRKGTDLWPGLRELDQRRAVAWEATSIPHAVAHMARAHAAFTRTCLAASIRLCRHGPWLRLGSRRLDMTGSEGRFAKLLTIDVARTCMADVAASAAARAHDFDGSVVLSAGSHMSDVAVVMRRLQGAGAKTVDLAHGWPGEPEPFTDEPPCDFRCVWSHTDTTGGPVRFLVGGMPCPERLPRPPPRERPCVLVMTNYMHRDDAVYQNGYDPYLDELLDVVRHRADRYAFRWRPHPADRAKEVARAAEGLPAEISRGRPLGEDLAWADVVVSTLSSAVPQALLAGRPVLVHFTPDFDGSRQVNVFAPRRTFLFARDGVEKLDAVVRALSDPSVLADDDAALACLFGDARAPRTLRAALAPLIA